MAMYRRLWAVIPAAGYSTRFIAEGYRTPKPFLRINHFGNTKSMLQHVIDSLPLSTAVVGLPPGFVHGGAVCYTIKDTRGQADTILQLLEYLPDGDACLVADCDVVVDQRIIQRMLNEEANLLVVHDESGTMSYVDDVANPTVCAEKKMISNWGIVGVRYFKNIGQLKGALRISMSLREEEPYLSHAMQHIPYLRAMKIERSHFMDWGTPEAVLATGAKIV